jgi:TrmH family RNA methyltransferase
MKPLKWYNKLSTKKGRFKAGAFLIEGERAVSQVMNSHPENVLEILCVKGRQFGNRSCRVRFLTEKQFRSISHAKTPQGIMAVVNIKKEIYSDNLPDEVGNKILLIEDVQDPGNVGSLIRTAAAFDFQGVLMTEKCADLFSPKSVQASAGSLLAPWVRRSSRYLDMVRILKEYGYSLIAMDLNGKENLSVLKIDKPLVLILGSEASGISRPLLELSMYRVKIPIYQGNIESINVAACGAICMFLSAQGKM